MRSSVRVIKSSLNLKSGNRGFTLFQFPPNLHLSLLHPTSLGSIYVTRDSPIIKRKILSILYMCHCFETPISSFYVSIHCPFTMIIRNVPS